MHNYKLIISYKGERFKGFQYQPNVETIENHLMEAIKTVFQENISITGSGRTDTGVHSLRQVINFKSEKMFDTKVLIKGINRYLPSDIDIVAAEILDKNFSARKNALAREYQYLFSDDIIPIYLKDFVYKVRFQPMLDVVAGIPEMIKGEHDFVFFRKLGSNEKSTVRTIYDFRIEKKKIVDIYNARIQYTVYCITIIGNSFLYSMVRNLVGAIFEVFKGRQTRQSFKEMIDGKVKFPYSMVPAKGLCLVQIEYDNICNLLKEIKE